MRSLTIAPAILLICGAIAAAEPDITILPRESPAKAIDLKAVKGQVVTLSAGKAKTAKWMLIDAAGADLVPTGLTAAFTASADGSYRVAVAADGELVLVVVQVGGSPPVPPKPPEPVPPVPDSPLKKKIRAAYMLDTSPEKQDQAKDLAALYRLAADLVASDKIKTSGEFLRQVKAASAAILPDELVGIRTVVSDELTVIIPEPSDAEFTPEQRAAAAKLFTELATILDSF